MRAFFSLILIGLLSFSGSALALFNSPSASSSNGGFNNNNSDFVTVEQAFPFYGSQIGETVHLEWDVMEGYYLYQQRLSVSAENAQIGDLDMVDGSPYQDEFFGSVNIYTEPLSIKVPLLSVGESAKLIVQYQGCAKAGFCYPPETKTIDLMPFSQTNTSAAIIDSIKNNTKKSEVSVADKTQRLSKESELAGNLADNWWTPFMFLALGIGLAFTPCVFPMYPILTSIVLGSGKLSQARTFGLSFVYVQGMALTYTLLGLVVASAGLQFQAALQHPFVLIGLSVLFVLLAMSMFGLYTIQLPTSVQTWLNQQSNKQKGGNLLGVFAMGAISGLVCSPCTTAPLSGALLYVAQSGDLLTGAVALYALGLGMGIPLIIVAVFGNKLLPRAGAWMDRVKILFGFILLAAPIFLIERIIPEQWAITLWGILGVVAFGWLYHVKNSLEFGGWKQSLVGVIAVLGLVASAMPVYNQWFGDTEGNGYQPQVSFTRITSVDELEQQLVLANKANKPVMLDFYADWCVACKEFEKYTFHTPGVESQLKEFVLLQADVTKNTPDDIELFKRLKVMGLPTIDFWDARGNYISNARLTGFVESEPFLEHLSIQNLGK
ncbi:protein-disulfide reductase DsbD [Vibrio algarum]|uniref:Thiol:disulfide interchange protein DsbD n=1 Tax=Vibrio algarum TaxID=3020714 RepID=A0ABT4YMH5_9VIBR|nr:protein-disulfide reductase DsbD [Vibrio sp. KJ40-1]MDB1122749.1 protein-disulfide reductase DsbD [Vibrio sp. KJ40-1]